MTQQIVFKKDHFKVGNHDLKQVKAFKEEYEFWRQHPVKHWWKENKKNAMLIGGFVIGFIVLFTLWVWFK